MPRPPSQTPTIHKNFNLPEDIMDLIEKQQGNGSTEKLVNLIRKSQSLTSFDNVNDLIRQGKMLIHAGFEKLIRAEIKKAELKAQEEINKKKQETRKILELEKIWFAEIPKMLENPNNKKEDIVIRWVKIITERGKEFAHIDSAIDIFKIFEEQYDLSKEMEKTKHEEALDNETEQEIDEKVDEDTID